MLLTSVKYAPESTTMPVWRPLASRLVRFLELKKRAGTWKSSNMVDMIDFRSSKELSVLWVVRKRAFSERLALILLARFQTKWQ